jgi:ferredoxin-NADP reductase
MQESLIEMTVSRSWHLAAGYRAVELRAKDSATLPSFDDGAVLDVMLDAGNGRSRTQPLHRVACGRETYVVGVRSPLASDAGALFDAGRDLLVRPPRALSLSIDPHARYVLFAGGLGLATIAGMAKRLADAGVPFELHHFAHSADRMPFCEASQAFAPHGQVHRRIGLSVDETGRAIAHALSPSRANTAIYCSGPPMLMDIVQREAREWVYPRNVHKIYLGEQTLNA